MGSIGNGFIRVSEAAEIVGCTEEKIQLLCRQGMMRHLQEGETTWVRKKDLEEVRQAHSAGELEPGEILRRLLFAEQEIDRLKKAVNILYEINNMNSAKFLTISDSKLLEIYQSIVDDAEEEEWPIKRILSYCEVFIKITEIEIDKINALLDLDDAWVPFYELCLDMIRFIGAKKNLKTDLQLQRVLELLTAGRKNLSNIAILFVEKASILLPAHDLVSKLAMNDIDMFDKLAKQLIMRKPKAKRGAWTIPGQPSLFLLPENTDQ